MTHIVVRASAQDFQGGFQIAAKRIGMLESFRAGQHAAFIGILCLACAHELTLCVSFISFIQITEINS